MGFNRVFVRCPDGLTVKNFAAAIKRGDGFVSNGPLLWLRVNGRLPGEAVELAGPKAVRVSVEVVSGHPVEMVELLRNGEVVLQKRIDQFNGRFAFEEEIAVDKPAWFAVRCFGNHTPRYDHHSSRGQFAHSNPLFVTVNGRRPGSPKDAATFVKEIDALIGYAPHIPNEALRKEAVEHYRRAREYFAP